jgi:hypothetical protein
MNFNPNPNQSIAPGGSTIFHSIGIYILQQLYVSSMSHPMASSNDSFSQTSLSLLKQAPS